MNLDKETSVTTFQLLVSWLIKKVKGIEDDEEDKANAGKANSKHPLLGGDVVYSVLHRSKQMSCEHFSSFPSFIIPDGN